MAQEWFRWYPQLFENDTMHLSDTQELMYRRMIDWYMRARTSIPNNEVSLAKAARVSLDVWRENAEAILPFFHLKNKSLHQRRCDLELDYQDGKTAMRSEVGRKGAESRWRGLERFTPTSPQNDTENHNPDTNMNANNPKDLNGKGNAQAIAKAMANRCQTMLDVDVDREEKEKVAPLPKESHPKTQPRSCSLDPSWSPNQNSIDKAIDLGFTENQIIWHADKMRNWAIAGNKKFVNWNAAFDNWIKREKEKLNDKPPNGHNGATHESGSVAMVNALARGLAKRVQERDEANRRSTQGSLGLANGQDADPGTATAIDGILESLDFGVDGQLH
jgi:uncharacterized protein YdaU (DUF1376 family)